MSSSRTIVHEWFEEVWNKGRAEIIDELLDKESVVHGLVDAHGRDLPSGPSGFKPFFQAYREAFPDLHIAVMDTVAEGDKIAARCQVRGTHLGATLGIEPTGAKVSFSGMVFIRIAGGKVVEAWNNFDFAAMDQQIEAARLVRVNRV
jgi:steroid delta-isomerase-like uncharacterized protein